jgi:hypothetical protein
MLSPDRKVDSTARYNWTDTIPMIWNLNIAKASCRYIFEKQKNLQLWYEEDLDDFEDLVDESVTDFAIRFTTRYFFYQFHLSFQCKFDHEYCDSLVMFKKKDENCITRSKCFVQCSQ